MIICEHKAERGKCDYWGCSFAPDHLGHQSSQSKGEEDEAWYILFDFWREYNAEKDSTKRDAIISAHTANLAKLLSERNNRDV